jgi:hypothetical protein
MDKKKNPIVGPVTDLLTEGIAQRVADLLRPQLDRAQTPLRLLSVNATGAYLGRTPWSIRALVTAGTLRAVRIDGRVMLDIQDLEALITSAKT